MEAGSDLDESAPPPSYEVAVDLDRRDRDNPAPTLPIDSPVASDADNGNIEEWACSACTFLNHPALERCECCQMERFMPAPRDHRAEPEYRARGEPEEEPRDHHHGTYPRDKSVTSGEPSYGFTAALVRTPSQPEVNADHSASYNDVQAGEDPHAKAGHSRPNFNTYISQENDVQGKPEATEMVKVPKRLGGGKKVYLLCDNRGNVRYMECHDDCPPNTAGGMPENQPKWARFLPTVSPNDVAISEEPRSVSMRVTDDTMMETCLDDDVPPAQTAAEIQTERFSYMDVEEGRDTGPPKKTLTKFSGQIQMWFESMISKNKVGPWGLSDPEIPCTSTLMRFKEPSKKLIIGLFFIILAIIVFLGVFPPSFVYLDYGQVALKKTKSTGYVNTKEVVYPGCHVLGPDIELKIFNSSAMTLDFASVPSFIKDQLQISFDCNFQYFLRAEDVGKLHDLFDMNYEPVIKQIAFSTLKTTTAKFSLENIRLNRSFVETTLHKDLQQKLGGDCCSICCKDSCLNHPSCKTGCNSDRSTCYPGYHVDIKYFNFGAIVLPTEITSLLLQKALLYVKAETEEQKQKLALETKETKLQVDRILNEAAEIKNEADVKADYVLRVATASAYANKSIVDMQGLRQMCSTLGVTDQDKKLSMYMLKTFNNMDNLYLAPGWKNASTYTGQGT